MTSTVELQSNTIARLDDKCRLQGNQLAELQPRQAASGRPVSDEERGEFLKRLENVEGALAGKERINTEQRSKIETLQEQLDLIQQEHQESTHDLQWQLKLESEATQTAIEGEKRAVEMTNERSMELQQVQEQLSVCQNDLLRSESVVEQLRAVAHQPQSDGRIPLGLRGSQDLDSQDARTRYQEGFRMKFDHSPVSSLASSLARTSIYSAVLDVANTTDEIDVLFSEVMKRKGLAIFHMKRHPPSNIRHKTFY